MIVACHCASLCECWLLDSGSYPPFSLTYLLGWSQCFQCHYFRSQYTKG
ncbi:hypothetical protein CBSLWZGG_CDS56 [Pseudomonas phage PseuPha1]|nr:hypothetical protein CBSLWZGG_CDS56 [Pseudomonas phage PseuPha1]